MVNFAEMSDYDLSKLIIVLTFEHAEHGDIFPTTKSVSNAKMELPTVDGHHVGAGEFDINDWRDIGPLIESYGISMTKCTSGKCWSADIIDDITDTNDDTWESHSSVGFIHINPKRAAAICIIKQLEIETHVG